MPHKHVTNSESRSRNEYELRYTVFHTNNSTVIMLLENCRLKKNHRGAITVRLNDSTPDESNIFYVTGLAEGWRGLSRTFLERPRRRPTPEGDVTRLSDEPASDIRAEKNGLVTKRVTLQTFDTLNRLT